ncbi:MAG: RdgB/HAM1 family non-canonical purine pyrophosphatase, dITP/XTP pyrophosphatase [Candidatus Saccharibacteria bacterium]|nr:RdgB/HAM1 family non-canonical purine pyrophosphatase, dITP/XTP pyrophosphatase [Candidatus Saccharibacteria bacterium]
MKQLLFSTGNAEKFLTAKHVCDQYGIELLQMNIDIVEIQEESPEKVAIDKATKAFEAIQKPVVITDDSWAFLGLNGFPGVYMHSINEWFTPEDFLRLTLPLEDRRAVLTQCLVYHDGTQAKVFTRSIEGELLKEIRGTSTHASHTVTTMPGDNGLSIAEAYDQAKDKSTRVSAQIWIEFAEWFNKS